MDNGGRIVDLKGEVALGVFALLVLIVSDRDAIHLYDNAVSLGDDLLGEPGINRQRDLFECRLGTEEMKRAGRDGAAGGVEVCLENAGHIAGFCHVHQSRRGTKEDPAVAVGIEFGFEAKVEILEVAPVAEEMADLRAAANQKAALDFP